MKQLQNTPHTRENARFVQVAKIASFCIFVKAISQKGQFYGCQIKWSMLPTYKKQVGSWLNLSTVQLFKIFFLQKKGKQLGKKANNR